jgi:hypothetical protein
MLRSDDARQRQRLLRKKPRKIILIKFIKIEKADEIERKTGRQTWKELLQVLEMFMVT